jgi:hypothetical protein
VCAVSLVSSRNDIYIYISERIYTSYCVYSRSGKKNKVATAAAAATAKIQIGQMSHVRFKAKAETPK